MYAAAQVYPAGHRLAGKRRSADTHRNALTVGRMIGDLCVKRGWLKINPFVDVEPVGARRHGADKIHLTLDEVRKLEAWCLEHASELRSTLTMAYMFLGCRTSEITSRNVRDVDDGGRLLWIRDTKSAAGTRRLVVPDVLAPMLVAVCAGRPADAPLFLGVEGARLSLGIATRLVRSVCVAAEVPEVTPQALRRTLATLATDAGVAGLALAASLGHASPDITNEAYIARGGAAAAAAARGIRVIQGGRK
ncbi:MAG TPA: tyrosine-type recombinase/integrase [Mycobacterium sp.]|nr:tyrosine-type recombinase/integrase [Mycobacterium sp.]